MLDFLQIFLAPFTLKFLICLNFYRMAIDLSHLRLWYHFTTNLRHQFYFWTDLKQEELHWFGLLQSKANFLQGHISRDHSQSLNGLLHLWSKYHFGSNPDRQLQEHSNFESLLSNYSTPSLPPKLGWISKNFSYFLYNDILFSFPTFSCRSLIEDLLLDIVFIRIKLEFYFLIILLIKSLLSHRY